VEKLEPLRAKQREIILNAWLKPINTDGDRRAEQSPERLDRGKHERSNPPLDWLNKGARQTLARIRGEA